MGRVAGLGSDVKEKYVQVNTNAGCVLPGLPVSKWAAAGQAACHALCIHCLVLEWECYWISGSCRCSTGVYRVGSSR